MKLFPRLSALLSISALSLGAGAVGASTASAELIPDGVYSVSYTGALFQVDRRNDEVVELSYADWRALGFPAPQQAHTDWVKYPWSSTIYAVTFFGSEEDEWVWEAVDYSQWRRAGSPAPRNTGWIGYSLLYKWVTSTELFIGGPDGSLHKLNYAEWAATDFRQPEIMDNAGFLKYSWNSTIVFADDIDSGPAEAITYSDWRDLGFPTPRTVARMPGDSVTQKRGSREIWYSGPGVNRAITFAEWKAMGSPAPTIVR